MDIINLHTHTVFSDGENTPREMIEAAIDAGLSKIGISDHSYTPFDESYCMKADAADNYRAEINKLKSEYEGRIKVLCGVEQDYYAPKKAEGYDYIIGSVHYFKFGDEYVAVDEDAETLIKAANKYFNGDFYKLAEKYFDTVSDIVNKANADIIGHFDLISKYNDKYNLFDVNDKRYKAAWKSAADKLLKSGAVFEINTGVLT
ncbi:MAG: histidinol-phosphatase HisJ family protein, partial [Clostridia bacterium]|nr:histidinol-phosphatase HisJ family protein [Clostridia bacterium]